MWTSSRKYRLNRGVGFVSQLGQGFIIDVNGRRFMIPKAIGLTIKEAEELKVPVGRPSLYDEPHSTKGITLPDSLWKKIGEPFSMNIYLLLTVPEEF